MYRMMRYGAHYLPHSINYRYIVFMDTYTVSLVAVGSCVSVVAEPMTITRSENVPNSRIDDGVVVKYIQFTYTDLSYPQDTILFSEVLQT